MALHEPAHRRAAEASATAREGHGRAGCHGRFAEGRGPRFARQRHLTIADRPSLTRRELPCRLRKGPSCRPTRPTVRRPPHRRGLSLASQCVPTQSPAQAGSGAHRGQGTVGSSASVRRPEGESGTLDPSWLSAPVIRAALAGETPRPTAVPPPCRRACARGGSARVAVGVAVANEGAEALWLGPVADREAPGRSSPPRRSGCTSRGHRRCKPRGAAVHGMALAADRAHKRATR